MPDRFNHRVTAVLIGCAASAALLVAATAAPSGPVRFTPRPKLAPTAAPARPATGGAAQFGEALPGLGAADLADFAEGRTEFEAVETAAGGLGPIFNGNSCVSCHSAGATGGASQVTVTRFGRRLNG